ncbi:nuclear transport factor 2 family protein [Sphingomonas cavernae]|uniref:Nuclear transport factor 2 family protein n=1 Tax=Sphingomonas cavernae TaxID=2320861 RepID=A0A418WME7_9SPHN|nr:nuclear transport factor 2 family protein [Sphingomonas cavernae]RJF91170.1 nuclear transport factor 2 family protein [Sphingomonas cavernae]
MTGQELVDRYFGGMRNRDVETLLSLFVEDAVMILPDGRELAGRDAIRAMYGQLFSMQAPSPTPRTVIASESGVATEIEARLDDGTSRRTANFFQTDEDGRIRRLSIYKRG